MFSLCGVYDSQALAANNLPVPSFLRAIPTAQQCAEAPLVDPPKLYRTGDLCKWTEDGCLEFLGRIDAQVKLRGFRVEFSEIESVLMQCDGVQSAVCTVRDLDGTQQLVAYVVPHPTMWAKQPAATIETMVLPMDAWRKQLRQKLPPYMIPAHFEGVLDFPTLPSGKADRKRLPAPRPRRGTRHV
jgi:acyl-coenzyme A synthetase/AMP-(fatty) acid ligase